MSSDNGSGTVTELGPDVEDASGLTPGEAPGGMPKVRFATGTLKLRDLKRAKVMLGGRDPFELMDDQLDAMTLTLWCVRSRTDPSYTWEQAEDASLDDFETIEDDDAPPPPTAAPTTSGNTRGASNGTGTKPSARRKRTSAGSTT